MKCTYCGAIIQDGELRCPVCGREVQIVPDYNPLDDVLAEEVKGSIADVTRKIQTDDIRRYSSPGSKEYSNATRVLNQGDMDAIRARRVPDQRQRRPEQNTNPNMRQRRPEQDTNPNMRQRRPGQNTNPNMRQSTSSNSGRQTASSRDRSGEDPRREFEEQRRRGEDDRRRQQMARKKRLAKKRQQRMIIIMVMILCLIAAGGVTAYLTSYSNQVNHGKQALAESNYNAAERYFQKAIKKNNKKAEAYRGLADIFVAKEDYDNAESVFLEAISSQPSNADLYVGAIEFYIDTEQQDKISELIGDCEYDNVLLSVEKYVSEKPSFSLTEGTYNEVQQVSLSSDNGVIYYTTDGSDPTTSSTVYEKPILLQDEGTTQVRAISVNENGIPSLVAAMTYTIELPMEDAPSVSPSTGQYDSYDVSPITITVPDGYTAYYTMDDTDPSDPASSATEYTGPVDMPAGQTMFSAVLMNNKTGRYTQVTKRNYVYEPAQ